MKNVLSRNLFHKKFAKSQLVVANMQIYPLWVCKGNRSLIFEYFQQRQEAINSKQ